jgi:YD repeat-containing protein
VPRGKKSSAPLRNSLSCLKESPTSLDLVVNILSPPNFVYDAAGNKTERTDFNALTTDYTFDALDRLSGIAYPNSTSTSYSYDALSRLSTATNANGTVTLTADQTFKRLGKYTGFAGEYEVGMGDLESELMEAFARAGLEPPKTFPNTVAEFIHEMLRANAKQASE